MDWYFYKTCRDGSKNRLRPLPGQINSDGIQIQPSYNVQVAAGGMKLREEYPIGTVFCSSMCEMTVRAGTPYYSAGDIYPILDDSMGYKSHLPIPTQEMLDAYQRFSGNGNPCEGCLNYVFLDTRRSGEAGIGCRFKLSSLTCHRRETSDDI